MINFKQGRDIIIELAAFTKPSFHFRTLFITIVVLLCL